MVPEPPVIWLNTSSGRASASVTWTFSTGTSISSAIIIAVEVVMPWPTSARGSSKDTVPSVLTLTVMRFAVGAAECSSMSLRSVISAMAGEGTGGSPWASAAGARRFRSAAATNVGAART